MAIRSFPVVTEYLEPNRPVTFIGLAMPMDTVEISATLTDRRSGEAVDLTGASAICVTTDKDKSTIWDAEITNAAKGLVKAVVQPDVVGMNNVVIKITSSRNDETTFFLGNLSVAADRRETGVIDSIISLTQKLLAYRGKIDSVQQALDKINAGEETEVIHQINQQIDKMKNDMASAEERVNQLVDQIDATNAYVQQRIEEESQHALDVVEQARQEAAARTEALVNDVELEKQAREATDRTLEEARNNLIGRIQQVSEEADALMNRVANEMYALIQQYGKQMSDAGIKVDPQTGEVYIYGVRLLDNKLSQVTQRMSAAEASINQRATYAEVDEKIARAQLDPNGNLIADGIYARINEVERDMNAKAGTLTDKVTRVEGYLGQPPDYVKTVSQQLSAHDASLEQHATYLNNVDAEITDVSRAMSATKGQIVDYIAKAKGAQKNIAEGGIKAILNAMDTRGRIKGAIVAAKNELKADIAETQHGLEVQASQLEILAGGVEASRAMAQDEKRIRANEDEALAEQIRQVQARVGENIGTVTDEIKAYADANYVKTEHHEQLRSDFNEFRDGEGNRIADAVSTAVVDIQEEAVTSAEAAAASRVEQMATQYQLGELSENFTNVNDRIDAVSNKAGSALTLAQDLTAVTNGHTATLQTHGQAITTLGGSVSELRETVAAGDSDTAALVETEKRARQEGDSATAGEVKRLVATTRQKLAEAGIKETLKSMEARSKQREQTALYLRELASEVEAGKYSIAELRELLAAKYDGAMAYIMGERRVRAEKDSAMASDIYTLSAKVDTDKSEMQAAIREIREASATQNASMAYYSRALLSAGTTKTNEAAIKALLKSGEWRKKKDMQLSAYIEEVKTKSELDKAEEAQRYELLFSKVNANNAMVIGEQRTRADNDGALATKIEQLTAATEVNFAGIRQELTAEVNDRRALAQTVATHTTTLNGHTASIQSVAESVDGLSARYGVRINADGSFGGFEVLGTGERIDAVFDVDNFYVGRGALKDKVFRIVTEDGVQKVYIQNAVIGAGSIVTDKIASGAISSWVVYGRASNQQENPLPTTYATNEWVTLDLCGDGTPITTLNWGTYRTRLICYNGSLFGGDGDCYMRFYITTDLQVTPENYVPGGADYLVIYKKEKLSSDTTYMAFSDMMTVSPLRTFADDEPLYLVPQIKVTSESHSVNFGTVTILTLKR